jgi:hypothetical protein
MKRLITGLAVLVMMLIGAGCGAGEPSGPAITVAWDPDGDAAGAMTATLTPEESPGGTLAFQLVRDGHMRTLARYRFLALTSPGTAQLEVGRRAIDAVWTLPGGGAGKEGVHVSLPRGSRSFGTAWSGSEISPQDGGGKRVIWAESRYVGRLPDDDSLPMGSLDSLIANSLEYPRRTTYCLTLEVEAQ